MRGHFPFRSDSKELENKLMNMEPKTVNVLEITMMTQQETTCCWSLVLEIINMF